VLFQPLWAGAQSSLSGVLSPQPCFQCTAYDMSRVASSIRSLRMCVSQRGSLWLSRYGGPKLPLSCVAKQAPHLPQSLALQTAYLHAPFESIWCFLNYICNCAHDTSCCMWLLGAISELQLYCAAPYTHTQCWLAAPILAHPTHAHTSLEPPWIATLVGTIAVYVSQEF